MLGLHEVQGAVDADGEVRGWVVNEAALRDGVTLRGGVTTSEVGGAVLTTVLGSNETESLGALTVVATGV